jgi:glycosidase
MEGVKALNEARIAGRYDAVWRGILHKGRDHARTPMQWDTTVNAGFTTGEPWIMVNPNYVSINAAAEENDPDSVLNFYRKLIALRNSSKTLQYGAYRPLWTEHEQLFAYERAHNGETYTVVCNMNDGNAELPQMPSGQIVLTNLQEYYQKRMLPYQALVIRNT